MNLAHGGDLFAIARDRGWSWRDMLDFSANINPLGPSPLVRDAIVRATDQIVHYPDRHASRLALALAGHWSIDPECILMGNGATELIHFLARTWLAEPVTLAPPVFSEFHRAWPGANLGPAPDEGLLVITNPNNPVGAAMRAPSRSGPTLIDESFIEFTDLESAIGRGAIVLRSLTKFYALPGLRVGALVAPAELVREWKKRREPWQVNVLAEAAALAALSDDEHAIRTKAFVNSEREWLQTQLRSLPGVKPEPALANYVFVRLDYSAERLCDYMLNHKVLIRNCSGWPGVPDKGVRVAVRTRIENERLIELWREFPCD